MTFTPLEFYEKHEQFLNQNAERRSFLNEMRWKRQGNIFGMGSNGKNTKFQGKQMLDMYVLEH